MNSVESNGKKPKSSGGKNIIIAATLILLAVIVIAAAFLVVNGDIKNNTVLCVLMILMILLAIIAWIWMFRSVKRKNKEEAQMHLELDALADVYEAMTLIDLKTDRMTLLRTNDFHDALFENDFSNYSVRIRPISKHIASDQAGAVLSQFMDPATYELRLRNLHSISHDFLDARGFWVRFQLIVVDRDEEGNLWHIIWAVESINEERKQQSYLRKLAETDSLSQLRNRNSGEAQIRQQMAVGEKGVFIMMDVDDFKSINDDLGSDVGDRVIVEVACAIRESFRGTDIIYRLGGDEFAVFLPGVEQEEQTIKFVDRLKEEIGKISFSRLEGKKISVSVGAAYYPKGKEDTFEALHQRAEQNMLENKKNKTVQ